jgi:anti-sigma-K factor RskA
VSDVSCPEVEAVAAELALGTVSGSERAAALSHLSRCLTCRRLVDALSAAADPLLLLAPEFEPSIGFESRVLKATTDAGDRPRPGADTADVTPLPAGGPLRPGRPGWARRGRVAVAAALVVLAGAGGLFVGRGVDDPPPGVRTALAVSASGRATCRAFAYGEEQAWVFVNLEAPREWTADYRVEVTTEGGGTASALGTLKLADGGGTLGATIDVPAERLRAIRVFDDSGALRYEAPFG